MQGSVFSLGSLIISERVTTPLSGVSLFGGARLFEYKILPANVNFHAPYFNMLKFQCLLKDLRVFIGPWSKIFLACCVVDVLSSLENVCH